MGNDNSVRIISGEKERRRESVMTKVYVVSNYLLRSNTLMRKGNIRVYHWKNLADTVVTTRAKLERKQIDRHVSMKCLTMH